MLQTTALVNEAFLRLMDWQPDRWQNRAHFVGVAATLMRRILVQFAREQMAAKRGGRQVVHVELSDALATPAHSDPDLVALDDALTTLETLNPRHARLVELRFFGGLTLDEAAEVLKRSVSTVRRDWLMAQAWLRQQVLRS